MDTLPAVARDEVACACCSATDCVTRCGGTKCDSVIEVAQCKSARYISTDEVTLDQVSCWSAPLDIDSLVVIAAGAVPAAWVPM